LLIRFLKIDNLGLNDAVVIEKNEVVIFWRVRGCYKIILNDITTISGNNTGLKYRVLDIGIPITLTFKGVFKSIKKTIEFKGSRIYLLDNFDSKAILPKPNCTIFNDVKLKCVISSPTKMLEFEIANLDFRLTPLVFDKFEYENYKS
jgi:hypothetical protein